MRSARLSWAICALVAATGGCAGSGESGRGVTYSVTAQQNYEKGLKELRDENFIEATKYFTFVKTKYPFSKFATLSELRIADTSFKAGRLGEAIDGYKSFMRFHPTHEEVESGYAAFRIAEAYVKQMPDDWFLVPPSYEKDQTSSQDALRELDAFLDKFPDSKYAVDARRLEQRVLRELARHELYVARFYLDHGKPRAAILRLEGVRERYPRAGVDPEVMLLLGQTYLKMERHDAARGVFGDLVRRHPNDFHAAKARLYLDYINQRFGPPRSPPSSAPTPAAQGSGSHG